MRLGRKHLTCLQHSHYILFITFLKENKYKMLLCIVVIFQSDFNMLHDFPAHNSSNLVVTVKKSSYLKKGQWHELPESVWCVGTWIICLCYKAQAFRFYVSYLSNCQDGFRWESYLMETKQPFISLFLLLTPHWCQGHWAAFFPIRFPSSRPVLTNCLQTQTVSCFTGSH